MIHEGAAWIGVVKSQHAGTHNATPVQKIAGPIVAGRVEMNANDKTDTSAPQIMSAAAQANIQRAVERRARTA